MTNRKLYLNCDMGEGLNNEAELMPFVQAANIACGGHAGDKESIEVVMKLAQESEVDIGIHPSYPDKENFGRTSLPFDAIRFESAWNEQFSIFKKISGQLEVKVNHIKPHGALYHDLSKNDDLLNLFLKICKTYFPIAKIFGAPQSKFLEMAKAMGFVSLAEGFADRGYLSDGLLAPRSYAQGVIHDAQKMKTRIHNLWNKDQIISVEGQVVNLKVDTICVHGDHPNAVENLKYIFLNRNN